MASNIPSLPPTAANTFPSTISFCHFFKKTFQISVSTNQKRNHNCFKVSCKAKECDQNPIASSSKNGETSLALGKFHRRDVLIGLGCLYGGTATLASGPIAFATPVEDFPIKLDKVVTVTVPRPKKSRSKKEKEEQEEVLAIEGIEVDMEAFVKFNVLINDEEGAAASGPDKTEFAGSFVNVPRKHKQKKRIRTRLNLGISDLLEDLGAEDDDTVLVTLIPKVGCDSATIGGVKIEFDS